MRDRPRSNRHRVSPATYRRVTLFAVWALGFIIVTGAAVRLTGSGLGCPDWPRCADTHFVSPWQYHAVIEFGNRMVTGAVSLAIMAAVGGSALRAPRRRDLTWLSWGLVGGLIGQIVLGGFTVKHKLDPKFVMAHLMLSMVLLWNAVVLHHRAGIADGPADARGRVGPARPPAPMVSREHLAMARLLTVNAAVVIFLGTIVTATGPHSGDEKVKRLARYSLHDVARLHSGAVLLLLGLTVITLGSMVRAGAPGQVLRRGEVLLGVLLAQGAVGYLQYFSGVPAWLVAIHVALAAALWAVMLQFVLGLTIRPPTRDSSDGIAPSADQLLTTV